MSGLFAFLIIGVGSTSFFFSKKYLQFHKERNKVLLQLASLMIAGLLIAVADNVLWILTGWLATALLLPSLIGFDGSRQSQQAKKYIRNHLLLGTILLSFGFMIILSYMDSYSLNELLRTLPNLPPAIATTALASIVIACLVQSSVFPFHKWLLTSMCAPTPISAFMHAGLISSGGILLIRLHTTLSESLSISLIVFAIGCVNAYLGNMWMRARPDIKSSLGCSTISQMGFMLMQIGLGCYTSAILHILLHGFYKSHHFLESPSAVNLKVAPIKEVDPAEKKLWFTTGFAATFTLYLLVSGKTIAHPDTSILIGILFSLVIGSCIQKIAHLIELSLIKKVVFSIALSLGSTVLYVSVLSLSQEYLQIDSLTPLMPSHVLIFSALLFAWHISTRNIVRRSQWLHILCLNAGAPYSNKRSHQGV